MRKAPARSAFEPQGFVDAWGRVLFFAMIFAISMDDAGGPGGHPVGRRPFRS